MIKEDIAIFIESQSINRNAILLLDYTDTKKAVEMCEENKINVLGIDAFSLQGNKLEPHLNKSVDFSSGFCDFSSPCEYLNQFDDDCKYMLFEITI